MGGMSQSFTDKLAARIKETGSALCVGLDPRPGMDDLEAIPALLRKVVEETAPYAAAFKPNIAYFEAMGLRGLEILEDLLPDMPRMFRWYWMPSVGILERLRSITLMLILNAWAWTL